MEKLIRSVGMTLDCKALIVMIIIAANQLDGHEIMGGLPMFNMLGSGLVIQLLLELLALRRNCEEEEVG